MSATGSESAKVTVEQLQRELADLRREMSERLVALEAKLYGDKQEPAAPPAKEEISPAEIALIAAAVTTFLGKKVRIRSARLVANVSPWSQTGRTSIQASHRLSR